MNLLLMQMLAALLYSSITDRIYSYAWFPPISISFIQLALGQARLFNYTPAPSFICWNLGRFSWKCSSLDCAAPLWCSFLITNLQGEAERSFFCPFHYLAQEYEMISFSNTHAQMHTLSSSLSLMHTELSLPIKICSSDLWSSRLKMQPSAPAYVSLCDIL